MPRNKLNPKIERQRQFHAFEVYRDLGYGRTFRAVARQVDASAGSISSWAKIYKWDDRIKEHNVVVAKRKEIGAFLPIDDPIAQKLVDAMDRMEAIIDSCFVKAPSGKFNPKTDLVVKNVEDLTKLIAEYRKFLETYHRFVADYMPNEKKKDRTTNIKKLVVNLGELSQQDRIDMMKGIVNGNVPRGNKQSKGGVQDADFTEVSKRGDEDGPGRDGVSGSPASGSSGDETPVRES